MARPWLKQIWAWGPAVGFLVAIFCVSGMSKPPFMVGPLTGMEKPGHFAAYAFLCVLLFRALRCSCRPWVFHWAPLLALILASAYAATDEFHQLFVPGRHGEVRDWAIDSLGALLAAIVLLVYAELHPRPTSKRCD
jgi:VanZ family protein